MIPKSEGSNAPQDKEQPEQHQEHQEEETQAENFLEIAKERKQEGTECFRKAKWSEALTAYQAALNCLPKRPQSTTPSSRADEAEAPDNDDVATTTEPTKSKGKQKEEKDVVDVSSPAVSAADEEIAKLRAVLNANIGACFVKLGDHKEAAAACSRAILDDPTYVKALERRAASNEIINSWTSLTTAQEDYNTLLKLVPSPSQIADIRRKLQYLKPRLEAAQKKETDEMLGKLKGLGNSILGNFGLSTDNFKFTPNGAGGYSMNFTQ